MAARARAADTRRAGAVAPRGRLSPRHIAGQHRHSRRRLAGAAGFRFGTQSHRRSDSSRNYSAEAELRACGAVCGPACAAARSVDRPVCGWRGRALHDDRPSPGASCRANDERHAREALGWGAARFPSVSTTFLAAIDWSLEVAPAMRPQCVGDLREALVSLRLLPTKMAPIDLLPRGGALQALAVRSPPAATAPAPSRRVSKRAAAACLAVTIAGVCAIGLFGFRSESKVPQPLAQAPLVERKAVARDADEASARATSRKPASSSTAPTTALGAGPHAACAGLGFWASSACMRRECSSPGRRQHPDCARLRADEEARLQREYSR